MMNARSRWSVSGAVTAGSAKDADARQQHTRALGAVHRQIRIWAEH